MRDKVVTVFGGAGFIGRHVVKRLAAKGATIRVATRSPETAGHLLPMGEVGQIVLARFAEDEATIGALVAGAWGVVNLIGILFERRPGDFERVQARLPGTIARAAAEAGAERLVHLSAIGADPASPSLYARTKAAGEAAVRAAFPNAVILRPSIVFGPEDGFFNRFAAMARIAPALPLVGGGATRFQPVYVGDVAEAVIAGLERPELAGKTFELGGPRVYTFKELLEYVLAVTGRRRLLVPLPFGLARIQARLLEILPTPPLTRDQVALLERDNVVTAGMPGLAELGIQPTPVEAIVPGYLRAYARWQPTVPVA
ncbi:MAG: complex I NDUFA9 subunit family protein [Geminicoccaceae bacterium]|nr:complex I NDUFA9 subunit family protein [Geminicoccaceae bacterium]MDW8368907.1 complex I NDUFA9 subunit family protein [Geminicoccaceae bacterium]